MINNTYKRELYIVDIFLQCFFAFAITAVVFYGTVKDTTIVKDIETVLESNVMSGLTSPDQRNNTRLLILNQIYSDNEEVTEISNKKIERSIYSQIIIFLIGTVSISLTVSNILSWKEIRRLFLDNIIMYGVLAACAFLTQRYLGSKYVTLFQSDIYDIVADNVVKLSQNSKVPVA